MTYFVSNVKRKFTIIIVDVNVNCSNSNNK